MPTPRHVAIKLDLEWPLKRHTQVFAGTQLYAQEQGWQSTIDEVIGDKLPKRRTKSLPYDGIIGRVPKPLAEQAIRLGLPVVNVWFSSPARELLPGVFTDYAATGRLRAEHLLARGFRNFAALTFRDDRAHEVEVEEFSRVVEAAGFRCARQRVALHAQDSQNWRGTEETITRWMDQWQLPVGIFVSDEMVGRLVAQLSRDQRRRVPQDVAIVTGYNEETICEAPRPSLSSVEIGYERIGYEAARLLDRLMDEKEKGKKQRKGASPEHIIVPPLGLVVRESTDFYAVDDELVAQALAFIAANSHLKIGQTEVAGAVTTGTKTLQRRFRKVLGRAISEEIRRVRIERAKRELSQTDRSLDEISSKVGFGPRKRMYEVFCRDVGLSPSEYRKQRQLVGGI